MKKVMCVIAKGFEEFEAVGTIALLRRAGIQVDVFALDSKEETGRFQLTLSHIQPLALAQYEDYDALFIPGGPHFVELLNSEKVKDIIAYFNTHKKYIAAICAGPTILGKLGYLKGKDYTCFTAMNEEFNGTYYDQYVVVDDHLITGRSVCATLDFGFAIIEALLSTEAMETLKKEIYYYQN